MSNFPDKSDLEYIVKIKKHAAQGMDLLEEGENLLICLQNEADFEGKKLDISECFTTAAKNFDKVRAMASELGNHTHPMFQYQWRSFGKKKPTDTDIAAVTYQIDRTEDGIHIISNYRCPNYRAADVEFYRYARDIKENFKSQAAQIPDIGSIGQCYMAFFHHYINKPLYARDVDNYYEKPLSDAIAETFVRGGDGPGNIRRISMALPDDKNYTEVYLIPFHKFLAWIQNMHNQLA